MCLANAERTMESIAALLEKKGFLCCAHLTSKDNYKRMLDAQGGAAACIDAPYERYKKRVQAHGIYSYMNQNFDKPYEVSRGDYPGIYMDLGYDKESIFQKIAKYGLNKASNILLLFPLSLLDYTKHWHFNLCDRCGSIGYDTYFPDTIAAVPSIQEILDFYPAADYCNEIVFHKSIPLGLAMEVIGFDEAGQASALSVATAPVAASVDAAAGAPANYVFYSDCYYSGMNISYYKQPDVYETTAAFYIAFIRRHLPEEFKYICDTVTTKFEMEDALDSHGLITYLHTR